eukprot:111398-Prorocentrum_minimum.AAC.1
MACAPQGVNGDNRLGGHLFAGLATGATPDGRKDGEPFPPGACPVYGVNVGGLPAMLTSVTKIPFEAAVGGVLNNVTISPEQLEVGHKF